MDKLKIIKPTADQDKVNLLIEKADAIRKEDPDGALNICKEAIIFAKSAGYDTGLAKLNLIAGVCCRMLSNFDKSLIHYFDALKIYQSINDIKGQTRTLNSIANAYLSLSDFSKATEYFDECIYLLESIGDLEFEATVLANKALAQQQNGNLINSLKCNLQSLSIYKSINKPIPHTLLNNIGIVYLEIGNYYVALKYFNSALKIEEEIKSQLDESFTLANIGRTYVYMDDCLNGVTYLSEALIIIRRFGNRQAEAQIFSNLGKAYLKLRCFPEAISYFSKTLKYYREIGDKSSVSHTLAELGELYYQLNDFSASKKYFTEGLKLAEEIEDDLNIVRNNTGLASLYIKFKDMESAEKYLEIAVQLAEKRNSYKELSKIFKLSSDGYMAAGNSEKSNFYLQKHYDYLKKLIQIEEENSIKAFTASHNFKTPERLRFNHTEKSEYYESYINHKSSELLKQAMR
jgi:tetratricopeptide (TPR) repeat protein